MLSDAELLDNQTQTLEEVLDKLHDRSDEPLERAVAVDVGTNAIQVAVECLHTLADLTRTIKREGVSKADVQALRAIQTRMEPYARLPTKVALEAYEGLFTPSRSMINQTVSQEASLAEFGKTLKEWFFIFVDFIIRVTDWCRKVWNSEDAIRARLKALDTQLMSAYNQMMQYASYSERNKRDPLANLEDLARTVLSDPKLTQSRSMIIAFNVNKNTHGLKNVDSMVDRYVANSLKDISSLKTHIEQNKPGSVSGWPGVEINSLADQLEQLTVAQDEKDYLIKAVTLDFWRNPRGLVTREIFAPSHNIEQVQKIAKEIRSIKRNANFDDLKEIDIVVQAIDDLTKTVSGLERIIKFKQQLYADYYKASATYANFYIRARDTIAEEVRLNVVDDKVKVVLDKLDKTWAELLDSMGI